MSLSKFAAPHRTGLQSRARLHSRLDALRAQHAAIWLHAPAGAGKTALVGAWLQDAESRAQDALKAKAKSKAKANTNKKTDARWFRVDALDRDDKTLFQYLAESARADATLPELEDAALKDIPEFARGFFVRYFAALPTPSVLVLDDVHELDFATQGEILALLVEAIPDGITVLATSRSAPPANLRTSIESARLSVLDWDELRFDAQEGAQFIGLDASHSAHSAGQQYLQQADGWAAALVLLREQIRRHDGTLTVLRDMDRTGLFSYLASELFERLDTEEQTALMAMALLPDVSEADALALLNDETGITILQRIYHDRLLIDRREGDPPRYVLHALFRDFLAEQAIQRLDAADYAIYQIRAADLLAARGLFAPAAQLYQQTGAHTELIALLINFGDEVEINVSIEAWITVYNSLPQALAEQDAWLQTLRGRCLFKQRNDRAAGIMAAAEDALRAQGEIIRVLRSLLWQVAELLASVSLGKSSINDVAAPLQSLCAMLPLIDQLEIEARLDMRLHSIAVYGCAMCNVQDLDLIALSQQALARMVEVEDPFLRLIAAREILLVAVALPVSLTRAILDAALGPKGLAELRSLGQQRPRHVISFAISAHWTTFFLLAEFDLGEYYFDLIQDIQKDLPTKDRSTTTDLDAGFLLARRRIKDAMQLIEDYRLRFGMSKGRTQVTIMLFDAFLAMHNGDYTGALKQAKTALDVTLAEGRPPSRRYEADVFTIFFAALAGDIPLAHHLIEETMQVKVGNTNKNSQVIRLLIDGDAAAQAGDMDSARPLLAQGLAMHSEGPPVFMARFAPLAERILDIALLLGIETAHVLGIIRRQELRAPLPFMGHWPWPIAVRTLGGFGLSFHGQAHVFKGKVPHKPLQILKALVQAPSRRQNLMSLAMTLWPEAADPLPAFQIALHRLRQLLGRDDAILLTESEVSLEAVVWNDFTALQDCAAHVRALSADTPLHKLRRLSDVLRDLYRGPFLPQDEAEPWLVGARAQAVALFHETAVKLAAALEAQDDYASAQALYWQALDAEPLAEQSWRALMRCCHAQGDLAACARAWERCRQNLSILINRQPSEASLKLATSLGIALENA